MEPLFYLDGDTAIATAHGTGPWDASMLHGGAPAGLIASLAERLPSARPMRVARLTIDLQRPVPVGPLQIATTVTREGRNIQTADITLSANGKQVVRASVLKVRVDTPELPAEAALPGRAGEIPAGAAQRLSPVGFNLSVEMRESNAADLRGAARAVWFHIERPWFETHDTTPLMRAAATGDYCNGFGSPLDFEAWTFINADLTLHFARQPVGEWIMLAANCWIGPDGRGIAFGELADRQGYFGRAAQTLIIAKR